MRPGRLTCGGGGWFVPLVLAAAALTLAGWLISGNPAERAVSAALAVLIVACPCALGLATPAALGTMTVAEVKPAAGVSREVLLRRLGAVEDASGHPIAAAVAAMARAELGGLPRADGFVSLSGLGVSGTVEGTEIVAGREKLLRDRGVTIPPDLAEQSTAWERTGRTVVLAGWDGQTRGAVAVADTVKPSAAADLILLRDDLGVIADAIPLAAAGFLNPLIAGAAMAASSVFVVASSIRLRRFETTSPDDRTRPDAPREHGQDQDDGTRRREVAPCPE